MKATLISFILLSASLALSADEDPSSARKKICTDAGGTPQNTVIKLKSKALHVDCKCGDSAFTPHSKGDLCRDGKILTEFDHYCLDSKAEIKMTPRGKFFDKKCMCGDKLIETPSLTTMCENGALTTKAHAP